MTTKKIMFLVAGIIVYIIMLYSVLKMQISTGTKIVVITGALILFIALREYLRERLEIA